ncbi:MAG: methyltransferase domain-containing protein [Hamadaea sp.]|nr:methyltransferase domain-containing protein [Hamadaea sp.]
MWSSGDAYEAYVGRWSRQVAARFLTRLGSPTQWRWVDAGCGTGVITETILAVAHPAEVVGIDPSEGFLATARERITDPRARFQRGDAQELPLKDQAFDAVVSGLVLNFVPDAARAAAEFARVTRPGGIVAGYVWDYADGMQLMRHFWDAAAEVDPAGADKDEGTLFPLCHPEPLAALWRGAGLTDVSVDDVEIPTVFADFDDYWTPFTAKTGAAPAYLATLPDTQQAEIRELLRERLPVEGDGSIRLTARAWAVRGTR